METKEYKPTSAAQRRAEKFGKKVTWSDQLTKVNILTPELSKFDKLFKVIFHEEEEENITEKEEITEKKDINEKKDITEKEDLAEDKEP